MCDERTKQPSQHAEERGGRSKLLKAQQGVVLDKVDTAGRAVPESSRELPRACEISRELPKIRGLVKHFVSSRGLSGALGRSRETSCELSRDLLKRLMTSRKIS